jgi:hypothetical protein
MVLLVETLPKQEALHCFPVPLLQQQHLQDIGLISLDAGAPSMPSCSQLYLDVIALGADECNVDNLTATALALVLRR